MTLGDDEDPVENPNLGLARRYVAALANLDVDALRSCYWPDAVIWHNVDQLDRGVEETLQRAIELAAGVIERRAVIRRINALPDGVLVCLDVEVTTGVGRVEGFPAAIVLTVVEGRIARSEEYLDSRQVARAFRG